MPVLHLHAHVLVRRDPADVAAHLASVPHSVWRIDVVDSSWPAGGALAVGTRFRQDVVVAGLTVRSESLVSGVLPGGGFSYEHVEGAVPMSGEFRVAPHDDGARVEHRVTMHLPGAWALLAPVLRFSRPRVMASSLDELRFRLEASGMLHHRPLTAAH